MITKHHYNTRFKWETLRNELSGLGTTDTVRWGASAISTILGKNSYDSKLRLFYTSLGLATNNFYNEATANGLMLESHIRNRYETYSPVEDEMVSNMMTDNRVNLTSNVDYILTNSLYPHIFASLDAVRIAGQARLMDGLVMDTEYPIDWKAANFVSHKSWGDSLPIHYQIQAQVQMMMMNVDYAEMGVLVEGYKFIPYFVERDNSLRDRIINEVNEFALSVLKAKQVVDVLNMTSNQDERDTYQEVLQSLEPAVGYNESDGNFLYELYSEPDLADIKTGNSASDVWAERYLKANQVIKLAEKYQTFAKNHLLQEIGEASGMLTDGYKTMRVSKGGKKLFKCTKR